MILVSRCMFKRSNFSTESKALSEKRAALISFGKSIVKNQKIIFFIRLMRLDKPIGIFLLLWPMLIALWVAGKGKPNPTIVCIFILGAIIMRSAGCVINDLFD